MADSYNPLVLPSVFDDLEKFIIKHKNHLCEQIISSVSHALQNDLSTIELFEFENSDYVVILNKDIFKSNLDNILGYYLETEQYEFCERVVGLQKLLIRKQYYEQKKRHKSKSPSKRKNK